MSNTTPKNLILLCGELLTDGEKSQEKNGEAYREYSMKITLPSGTDVLPVLIAKSQIDETVIKGAVISVTGKLLSLDIGDERQVLKVLVGEVYAGETEITSGIFLTGKILKKPYVYSLESGERAEFHLLVETEEGDSVRVPVSCAGDTIATAKGLREGDVVSVLGQLHSYEYLDLNGSAADTYTAYEVEILTFTSVSFS
jgi:hypothetical protein